MIFKWALSDDKEECYVVEVINSFFEYIIDGVLVGHAN